jgi:hypothetical protein
MESGFYWSESNMTLFLESVLSVPLTEKGLPFVGQSPRYPETREQISLRETREPFFFYL